MERGYRKILAIDCGGSSFRKAIVCGNEVVGLKETPFSESVEGLLDFIGDGLSDEVKGISYSVGGIIKDHNEVVVSPNLHFLVGIELALLTSKRFNRAAMVCHDMESSVTGQAKLFPHLRRFLGLTVSSGIGAREFRNGEILYESEIGHMQLDLSPFAQLCGCKKRGCVEAVLAGKNLQVRVLREAEIWGVKIPSEYKNPSIFLHEEYDKGHAWAVSIYKQLIWGMARFLANLQFLLHLPAIVWKGALGKQLLTRAAPQIRSLMREMLIDPKWEEDLEFYYCWDVEPCKDADALIGAADILCKMHNIC